VGSPPNPTSDFGLSSTSTESAACRNSVFVLDIIRIFNYVAYSNMAHYVSSSQVRRSVSQPSRGGKDGR
jgi:hypothetical protein